MCGVPTATICVWYWSSAAGQAQAADGTVLATRQERVRRWEQHFSNLLSVETEVSSTVLEGLTDRPTYDSLGDPPSMAEVMAAISQLKKGKAHGADGVQPELLMGLDLCNTRVLTEMPCQVWEGLRPMPAEWRANYLVPIPKKGDLTECGQWRGILLSSVPGKIFNARLQAYLEQQELLPETQCGFRAGRGTTDMIFTLRVALEIARVKSHPLYVLFVDLAKAYDSVSRGWLWTILHKKGVPNSLSR